MLLKLTGTRRGNICGNTNGGMHRANFKAVRGRGVEKGRMGDWDL